MAGDQINVALHAPVVEEFLTALGDPYTLRSPVSLGHLGSVEFTARESNCIDLTREQQKSSWMLSLISSTISMTKTGMKMRALHG